MMGLFNARSPEATERPLLLARVDHVTRAMPRPGARQTARIVAGVAAQARATAAFLTSLPEPAFARPTRLPGWDLRLLTAHLAAQQLALIDALEDGTPNRPTTLANYVRTLRARAHRVTEEATTVAGDESGPALARQLRRNVGDLVSLVAENLPEVVHDPPLRTQDYLRWAAVDWVTHSDDINQVFGATPITFDRQAQADAVRSLASVLAANNPGHSVEVRVPPFAAVQCGREGDPSHTRGTPPNVVEADPMTFLRIATGRVRFADAGSGLTASGTRADISDWLPLI